MPRERITLVGILIMSLALSSGCRTSQQTRRNSAASQRNAQAGHEMDSLLMVQNKLLTVIDTMASVVAQDRVRIHELEIEVARLKSLIDQKNMGGPIPPPAPPLNSPLQNFTAPQEHSPNTARVEPPHSEPIQTTPNYPQNDRYAAALKLFNDGKYIEALTSFDELSRTDASSQYAPNYFYWKGESLCALGQYEEAIRAFHDVLTKYPESSKADDAEFKIGSSYEKLGDPRNAKSAYQRLILSYPQSDYRARAEARLNKLK